MQGVTRILHCGDMRWQPGMADHPALAGKPLDILYLDTTYAAPRHLHPPQVRISARAGQFDHCSFQVCLTRTPNHFNSGVPCWHIWPVLVNHIASKRGFCIAVS